MNHGTTSLCEVGEADFAQTVLGAKEPMLTVFWAPWSQPCRILLSVLEDLVSTSNGTIRVTTVNADDNLLLSLNYQIQSIPTLLCFHEGYERDRIVGTASKVAILSKFKAHLNIEKPLPPAKQDTAID